MSPPRALSTSARAAAAPISRSSSSSSARVVSLPLRHRSGVVLVRAAGDESSKSELTGTEKVINSITSFLNNSPLAQGKKALAIAQAGSDYDSALYSSKVDAEISSAKGKVMVFSWSGCPFCKKAKALLDSKGAKYSVLELDQMEDGQKYRAALAERTGRTSMPSIFIGGKEGFIGGFGDGSPGLKPLNDSGELDGKLKAAGAL